MSQGELGLHYIKQLSIELASMNHMLKLTFFRKNLHLQHAPPMALMALMVALAASPMRLLPPVETETRLVELAAELESKTNSWNPELDARQMPESLRRSLSTRLRLRGLWGPPTDPDLLSVSRIWAVG